MIDKKDISIPYETYPFVRVENNILDENDPVLVRKKEEAIKALTECPLPDFLLKRIEMSQ